jgi:hypothetical protein
LLGVGVADAVGLGDGVGEGHGDGLSEAVGDALGDGLVDGLADGVGLATVAQAVLGALTVMGFGTAIGPGPWFAR